MSRLLMLPFTLLQGWKNSRHFWDILCSLTVCALNPFFHSFTAMIQSQNLLEKARHNILVVSL